MKSFASFSDNELIALVKRDNVGAFQEIFDRYHMLLLIYANKKIQDKETSKDIVQEVFTNIWVNRERLELTGPLVNYLYTSIRNRSLNFFRTRNANGLLLSALQQVIDSSNESTDYLIREKDIQAAIDLSIAELPPKMREVFELRKKHHYSNKEIAELLNISEQTVATHMKRALRILRGKLGVLYFLIWFI